MPAYSRSSAIASPLVACGAIRAIRLQCAVAIGDRQDSGADRDILAAQSGGIAETIPALVMTQNEIADRRAERNVLRRISAPTRG